MSLLLVGTGNMGREYAKVLFAMNVEFEAVGRGEVNAQKFAEQTGKNPMLGGIEKVYDSIEDVPTHAIVAVGDYDLCATTKFLLSRGIKRILVEKPAGASIEEVKELSRIAAEQKADVYVAYNRRFYASVDKALLIIEEDGGVKSFNFEFTEWMHLFEKEDKEVSGNIEQVLFGNSGHVIDLAFFLGGLPVEMTSYRTGNLEWYGKNRAFSGAGISNTGAVFSYQANWDAPGRWGVEVLTANHRLVFKPLEKLQIQEKGSVKIDYIDLDDQIDLEFKPGLYREVEAFLQSSRADRLQTINCQVSNWEIFYKILGKK